MNLAVTAPDPLATGLARLYRHGFVTNIETDALPLGLDEPVNGKLMRLAGGNRCAYA